jgi:lysyl-tRNA synthetase class 2
MAKDWQPIAELDTLKRRAQYISAIRLFFAERQVLEVETPILSPAAPTAPYLDSFQSDFIPLGSAEKSAVYLQTSPEFAMKRLLAAGSGSIYQLAKVFRNGEQGRLHSPEFTMLEWYRPELNLTQLMSEVNELLITVFGFKTSESLTYSAAFQRILNVDVLDSSDQEIKKLAEKTIPSLGSKMNLERDAYLELLMSEVIEPRLTELADVVFIYDFPASQAQLAKIKTNEKGQTVAARFEVYASGLELANGYDECLDAEELRQRFMADNVVRKSLAKQKMPIDEKLLAAMQAGLPQCTGVALGLDRLLMRVLNKSTINDVLAFNDL